MTCEAARDLILDHVAGRLEPTTDADLRVHLARCDACSQVVKAERALSDLLAQRLPRHAAPWTLRRRLARLAHEAEPTPRAPAFGGWRLGALAAAAAALVVAGSVGGLAAGRRMGAQGDLVARLGDEAVGDHQRVLHAQQPFEVVSGGSHQVKPWFEGKLDFAPAVPLPAVPDLRLEGGAVGRFLDRDAAVVAYRLRLHRVTLLVFRAAGLQLPDVASGSAPYESSRQGFHAFLWRRGELGYALVSDVSQDELRDLAGKLAGAT
jgi:anti-sigma factor RsiW